MVEDLQAAPQSNVSSPVPQPCSTFADLMGNRKIDHQTSNPSAVSCGRCDVPVRHVVPQPRGKRLDLFELSCTLKPRPADPSAPVLYAVNRLDTTYLVDPAMPISGMRRDPTRR